LNLHNGILFHIFHESCNIDRKEILENSKSIKIRKTGKDTNDHTEKNKHVEELFHQYFEGLVKDIQLIVSVVCDNRRINV
jgi:hypothetical protein